MKYLRYLSQLPRQFLGRAQVMGQVLWVYCAALFLLLHHEMAGAGGSGFESPNPHTSSPSKASPYETPLLHKNLPGLPANICLLFKCRGYAG